MATALRTGAGAAVAAAGGGEDERTKLEAQLAQLRAVLGASSSLSSASTSRPLPVRTPARLRRLREADAAQAERKQAQGAAQRAEEGRLRAIQAEIDQMEAQLRVLRRGGGNGPGTVGGDHHGSAATLKTPARLRRLRTEVSAAAVPATLPVVAEAHSQSRGADFATPPRESLARGDGVSINRTGSRSSSSDDDDDDDDDSGDIGDGRDDCSSGDDTEALIPGEVAESGNVRKQRRAPDRAGYHWYSPFCYRDYCVLYSVNGQSVCRKCFFQMSFRQLFVVGWLKGTPQALTGCTCAVLPVPCCGGLLQSPSSSPPR
eukprot:COSAG01_NODE_10869_length_2065_cov_6.878942_2_plen_317_part_00